MAVKVLELCHVAPPSGSVQPCTVPLTFFDLVWYMLPVSTERLFLYRLPRCSAAAFLSAHLPDLKLSLSLALQLFFPLAGRLLPDTATDLPCIRYSDGDSVALTVAESDDDLEGLISDGPKDNARFRCLVPALPTSETSQPGQPVVSLQVTLLPEQGIAVGITALHVAMDGCSFSHFMRAWASLCSSRAGEEREREPPLLDRSRMTSDPIDLHGPIFSKIRHVRSLRHGSPAPPPPGVVRATFRLTAAQVEDLRKWVVAKSSNGGARFSSFTLAVSLAWTCLLRARQRAPKESEWLIISGDCRPRLDPPLPASYFGNAVTGCLVEVEGSGLVGEEGLAAAAAAIRDALRGFPAGDAAVRKNFESNVSVSHRFATLQPLGFSGSTRLGVYEVDFGWGRPAKVEVVSIDSSGVLSLSEDGGGGLEMGMAFPPDVVEEFTILWGAALKACS